MKCFGIIVILAGALLPAQDKPTSSPKQPILEELQKQVSEKDAQIARLQQQIILASARAGFLVKQLNSCIEAGVADEAQLAKDK